MERIFNIIPGPQADTCCILLYGEIGDYADVTASDIVSKLMAAEQTYRKIDVRINSVGGEVFTGIAIFNALRQSKADITIYIDCIAASTASFIAGCGRPVKMGRFAQLMLHRPTSYARGDAKKLAASAAQLEQIESILCQIYAERTGRTVEDIRTTYMDGADHWLTADEALALGFVDEIFDDPSAEAITDSLTPQQRCDRYTARYLGSIVSLNTEKQMFEKIKGMPTFSDCADEAAAVARVADIAAKAKERDALAKEIEVLRNKISEYEEKERSAQEAAYDAEVDAALKEERISATEADSFKALMRKDPENTRALLSSRKPKRRATSVIDTTGDEPKTDKDYLAEREAEVRAKLEK
nr:MAG TPA: Putative ATP dependent Clp protease [Caudoviricetes sp.]